MPSYAIREIEPSDIEQLAIAHMTIWNTTYTGMIDRDKLESVTIDDRIQFWNQVLDYRDLAAERGVHTRCAIDSSNLRIMGFATGGISRDPDPVAPAELWALNVLPEYHGSGVAEQLMHSVIGNQCDGVYLWVATGNERAIAFYRKHRFELDGATRVNADWNCAESRVALPAARGTGMSPVNGAILF